MPDPEDSGRGARDAATALPFLALFLIMPPIIHIFAKPTLIAGIPLIVAYVFCWWAAAIAAAFLIARRLGARQDDPPGGQDG